MQLFTQTVRRMGALRALQHLDAYPPLLTHTVRWLGALLAILSLPLSLLGLFAIQGIGTEPAWEQTLNITSALTWALAAPLAAYAFIKRRETKVVAAFAALAAALALLNAALLLAGVIMQGEYEIPLIFSTPYLLYLIWAWLPFRHGGGGARPATER